MVQDAGNRLPRLSDLTSNEFISISIDLTEEKLKIGMEPREIVPFTKVLNQLTGPLVGLCGEDKYFGVVGVMDAQVDIEVQL